MSNIKIWMTAVLVLVTSLSSFAQQAIPVRFSLKEAGYVTLVIENKKGVRVRNLISETWFPAGENVAWWDGTDDLGRDVDAANHGVYHIPAKFVEPGQYRVRGLVRGTIQPFYEFSPYYTGTPPWRTQDHTGAWLANHTPPKAALFVSGDRSPTGQPSVVLGAYVTEGPDGLAWVDLDGRKRGGKAWIGGHWTAAPFLAGDNGEKAVPGGHVYVASVWETSKQSGLAELRLNALTADKKKNDYTVKEVVLHPLGVMPKAEVMHVIGGLAAYNGTVVVSMIKRNQLLFVDAAKGKVADSMKVAAPGGLAFDAQGRLLVLSGNKLLRYPAGQHTKPEQLVTRGLEEPCAITLDREGNIYVSDRGNSHVVKIFSARGKFLRSIGTPGAPRAGAYDPLHMNHPAGIAIDAQQQLWVTEEDYLPKRVSVWTLDGKLVNAFYGPPKYGGGGTLDGHDKSRFYYAEETRGAMEFILDWEKGTSELSRIYYKPVGDDLKLAFRSAGPEIALYHKGKRYFTNSYNSSPTNGHSSAFLFVERDGVVHPAAAMGRAALWDKLKEDAFKSRWPAGVDLNGKAPKNEAFYIWQDLNADAQVQPDEVDFRKGAVGGVTIMPDLSFCISRLNDTATRFLLTGFTKAGIPQYDFAKKEVLATGVQRPASSGGDQVLVSPDGWVVTTLGMEPFSRYSFSGAKNGVPLWSYPNMWPGLHASHTAPLPDHRGQLVGPTRLLGGLMPNKGSDAGPLWAVNGNHGTVYVFTADGLFVATLFVEMRSGKLWRMDHAERNMPLDSISLGEENFWPSITQTEDGTVYLVDGARSAIVRLDGMDNIHRLPDAVINVNKTDLERSRVLFAEAEAARQREQGVKEMNVAMQQTKPVVDGQLNDWKDASWADIDKRGVKAYFNANTRPYDLTGAAAVSGERLYVAYRTGNEALLENSGEMPVAPFKTGGALDVMIGANGEVDPDRRKPVAGDCRLLVTVVNGKPLALVYRAVVPGTREEDKIPFSSPANTITFDKVEDVSSQLEFAGKEGNYEISIPVSVLGLKPSDGLEIKGDLGILRGEKGQTTARSYWSNKATGITSDVPSEAMLMPNLWGKFKFSNR